LTSRQTQGHPRVNYTQKKEKRKGEHERGGKQSSRTREIPEVSFSHLSLWVSQRYWRQAVPFPAQKSWAMRADQIHRLFSCATFHVGRVCAIKSRGETLGNPVAGVGRTLLPIRKDRVRSTRKFGGTLQGKSKRPDLPDLTNERDPQTNT